MTSLQPWTGPETSYFIPHTIQGVLLASSFAELQCRKIARTGGADDSMPPVVCSQLAAPEKL